LLLLNIDSQRYPIADLPARLAAEALTGPVVVIIGRALADYVAAAARGAPDNRQLRA